MDRLEVIDQVLSCTNCELVKQCISPVPMRGPSPARVAVLGEAPGVEEDKAGKPFVGRSGKRLAEHLQTAGLDLEEFAVINTASCYPHGTPTPEHVAACAGNRDAQLELANPEFVLILGRIPLTAVRPPLKISAARGKPFQLKPGRIGFATFHPAAALRSPTYNEAMVEDIKHFAKLLSAGIGEWEKFVVNECWECQAEVAWYDHDYVAWCARHAPASFAERIRQVDEELTAARMRLKERA